MNEFQTVLIGQVVESKTNPRRTFRGMDELIASIRAKGVLVPLLVRPINGHLDNQSKNALAMRGTECPSYEIVAGARRYRAAMAAELAGIPVRIMDLGDDEALELQVIENLQREDVHPMEEALGYRALLDRPGYDVAAIAGKVGRSESYVYQRLKLMELIKPAQKMFLEDSVTAGHAILIARLQPGDQKRALEACFDKYNHDERNKPCLHSVRDLDGWIHREIMLDLHKAVFKKDDADLVPAAGPCTTCTKRTGFLPALFPDISHKDTCTDRACYDAKKQAFLQQRQAELEAQGTRVLRVSQDYKYNLRSAEEKKLLPRDAWSEVSKKNRCDSAQKAIVVHGDHDVGKVMDVCADPKCKTHHGRGGYARDPKEVEKEKKAEAARRREVELRKRILADVLEYRPARLAREDLNLVAMAFIREMHDDSAKSIVQRHGWPVKKYQYGGADSRGGIQLQIPQLDDAGLQRLLIEFSLQPETIVSSWQKSWSAGKETLLATAARYDVDVKAIEAQLAQEFAAKNAKKAGKAAAEKAKAKQAKAGEKSAKPTKAVQKKAKKAKPVEPACEKCGCTETKACVGPLGPCIWAPDFLRRNPVRHVCTMCELDVVHDDVAAEAARRRFQ